jgi:glycosyltransferase involved in cell wall biosynthesis
MKNQAESYSTFTVLSIGTVTPRKGHVDLFDALADVPINYSLLLRGNVDPVMEPLLNRYRGTYRFVPPVSYSELNRYYQQADVFVLPSLSESFGLAILEAMASGLPVIVSENSASFVTDGYDGFVVPIRDPRVIKQRLLQLREDPELRRRMGRNARRTAELFTWEATRARHGDIMRAAVVARKSGYSPGSQAWEAVSRFKFDSGAIGSNDRPNDS